jgi:hypothetical protein
VLLSSAAIAHADTFTYNVTSIPGTFGTLSGTISGTGMTVTSFDLTAVSNSQTFTFDSTDAGSSGHLSSEDYYTVSETRINEFNFLDPQGDGLYFDVTGDFTGGLACVNPQPVYDSTGAAQGDHSGIALRPELHLYPLDNLSLTPNVAAAPEPSS